MFFTFSSVAFLIYGLLDRSPFHYEQVSDEVQNTFITIGDWNYGKARKIEENYRR